MSNKIGEGRTLSRLATPLPTNWGVGIALGIVLGFLVLHFAGKK